MRNGKTKPQAKAKKKTTRGRKQDLSWRTDYEVRYEAKEKCRFKAAVKKAVKKVGASRKRVERAQPQEEVIGPAPLDAPLEGVRERDLRSAH
ncbi:DUF3606 domain-containing protein [Bradyrhizobium sp. BRP22]|uniref:DUF3606 domain-containing protein n=1 Tax=Bradyrhizobium sp. BRP22 TaxID=2793821 RepID=UPI0031FE1F2B